MAGSLGSLVVSLTAETAQFTQSLNRASYTAQKNFQQITSFAKTAAGSLAALYGAGTFADFINQQIQLADKLDDLSQKLGISTEELSKLQYAAKFSGVDLAGLQVALTRLSKGMLEAANETGTTYKALNAMGIAVKNTDGTLKSSTQVLNEVADAFAGYEDGAGKTALATTIFGRAGAELIPMLNEGSKGIKAYGDELQRFGAVVTTEAAAAAAKFNDNLDRIKTVGTAMGQSIANDIIPFLNKLAEEFLVARANGLGFLDMLDMGLRFGNYGEQIKKINEEIEGLQTRFSIFDLTGGKDERLQQLMNQKKALQELQSAAALTGKTYEDQISRRFMRDDKPVKKQAPIPEDEAQMKKYMMGLASAIDANARFTLSLRDMARQAQLDLDSVFMTDNQIKNQQNLLKIQKNYETAAIAITKQFKDGNLTAKDYTQQIANLSDTYNDALGISQEIFDKQEQLNMSYEYGATVALAQYVNQSKNLATASSTIVTNALQNTEDALLGVVTGSQSASQAFSQMVTSILKDIARLMIRQSIVAPLAGFLSSAVGSFFTPSVGTTSTGLMTFDGLGYGGGRALGGRVNAGTSYLVGEQGAEKFVPSVDGSIIPNSAMGQTNNVVVNVNMENGTVNSSDAGRLGILIGNVVKQELVKQKRAGGLLA